MLFQGVLSFKHPSYSAENKREEVVVDQVEYHYVGEKAKRKQRSKEKAVATNTPCLIPYLYTKVNSSTVTSSTPEIPLNTNCAPISKAVNTPGRIIFFAVFIA